MKDKNSKYIIVECCDIYKQLYDVKRVATFNDFDNLYIPSKRITIKSVFIKYGVPVDFRKVVIKKNNPFLIRGSAEEYTLGFSFDLTKRKVMGDKYINAVNHPVFYDSQVFNDKITFNVKPEFVTYDKVIGFLQQLNDSGYLNAYMDSINCFFDMYLDLEQLFETYDAGEDVKEFIKSCRIKSNRH